MRKVREQMLCIVSPGWAGGPTLAAELRQALQRLCHDVEVIHFSSLALLPAAPGSDALPSLMLEFAVDEGLRPADLLARLAFHPSRALPTLYECVTPAPVAKGMGEHSQAVLDHLLTHLSVADGAFVGVRDRTVAQIRLELQLLNATRREASRLPAALQRERSSYALALARWAFQAPQFETIASPAPRSFWRNHGTAFKLAYLVAIVGVGAFVLCLLRLVLLGLGWQWGAAALGYVLQLGGRLLVISVAATSLFTLLFVLLPTLIRPWRRWLRALEREMDRPTQTWSSRTVTAFVWLLLGITLTGLLDIAVYVLFGYDGLRYSHQWRLDSPPWLTSVAATYAALFASLLLILVFGLRRPADQQPNGARGWLVSRLHALKRWFHRPEDDEIPRAQQVHPSIEQSEVELVRGTAHLISLTELRRPYAWSAWWTRLFMRVVTIAGHIFFTEGRLGDAPGIQFGHWHIIEGGRRLLFCSNFDGTFGGYLDDFINGASSGATLFWRWTQLLKRRGAAPGHPDIQHPRDFPPTRFVLHRGVKCELKFKSYARDSMLPHLFRYDACGLSAVEKIRATELRDALFGTRTEARDDLIMRVIES